MGKSTCSTGSSGWRSNADPGDRYDVGVRQPGLAGGWKAPRGDAAACPSGFSPVSIRLDRCTAQAARLASCEHRCFRFGGRSRLVYRRASGIDRREGLGGRDRSWSPGGVEPPGARRYGQSGIAGVMIDARRGEIYAAVYDAELRIVSPEVVSAFQPGFQPDRQARRKLSLPTSPPSVQASQWMFQSGSNERWPRPSLASPSERRLSIPRIWTRITCAVPTRKCSGPTSRSVNSACNGLKTKAESGPQAEATEWIRQ